MIYLDMDGPLVNFNQGLLDLLDTTVTHDDLDQWEVWKCLGMPHNQAMWDVINPHGSDWWKNLKPYHWAMTLYKSLKAIDNVTILTNPSWSPNACKGKLEWLQERFGLEFDDWIFTSKKEYLSHRGSILIDDSPENCAAFMDRDKYRFGDSILFPLPWNKTAWACRPDTISGVVPMVEKIMRHNRHFH